MKQIFKYVKAAQFFPEYAPQVKQHGNKITGSDGRRTVDFSNEDKKAIKEGLKKMVRDISKESTHTIA
jgi:hypothetical protein